MSNRLSRAPILAQWVQPRWQRLAFIGSSAVAAALLVSFTLIVHGATQRAGQQGPAASAAPGAAAVAQP